MEHSENLGHLRTVMCRNSIPIPYQTSPGVLRSMWLSGFKRAYLAEGSGIALVKDLLTSSFQI